MSKIITVFGATGNQGGSVIDSILADASLSSEFKIRAVTRDTTKPKATALADRGVEVVSADLASPSTLGPAIDGAHTVFLVTNFWESMSAETEIAQGKAVIDAAKAAGVKHLIASTLLNITEISNGRLTHLTHFDGKAQIEQYARDSGVPSTFVLPGFFLSNLVGAIRKGDDGVFTYAIPVPTDKAQFPIFDPAADTGKFVKAAIKHFPSYTGKRILAATAYLTADQMMADFSEVHGQPAKAVQVPEDVFKSFLPPPIAQEMLENFLLFQGPGYYNGADLSESLSLLEEKPTTMKEWCEKNKSQW